MIYDYATEAAKWHGEGYLDGFNGYLDEQLADIKVATLLRVKVDCVNTCDRFVYGSVLTENADGEEIEIPMELTYAPADAICMHNKPADMDEFDYVVACAAQLVRRMLTP